MKFLEGAPLPQENNEDDFQKEVSEQRRWEIRNAIQMGIFSDHFGFEHLMEQGGPEKRKENQKVLEEAGKFNDFWLDYEPKHADVYKKYEEDPDVTTKEVEREFESKLEQAA